MSDELELIRAVVNAYQLYVEKGRIAAAVARQQVIQEAVRQQAVEIREERERREREQSGPTGVGQS
jgi:hypothetical protein